jgi:hypothetical protein
LPVAFGFSGDFFRETVLADRGILFEQLNTIFSLVRSVLTDKGIVKNGGEMKGLKFLSGLA